MAIKPQDADTFLKEVDEELRKERLNQFVARYGWWILAAVVLVLGAIGGALWWNNRQEAKAAEQGEALIEALDSIENGNRNAASPKIAQLAASDTDGYRVAALFDLGRSRPAPGGHCHPEVDRRGREPRRALPPGRFDPADRARI